MNPWLLKWYLEYKLRSKRVNKIYQDKCSTFTYLFSLKNKEKEKEKKVSAQHRNQYIKK